MVESGYSFGSQSLSRHACADLQGAHRDINLGFIPHLFAVDVKLI